MEQDRYHTTTIGKQEYGVRRVQECSSRRKSCKRMRRVKRRKGARFEEKAEGLRGNEDGRKWALMG